MGKKTGINNHNNMKFAELYQEFKDSKFYTKLSLESFRFCEESIKFFVNYLNEKFNQEPEEWDAFSIRAVIEKAAHLNINNNFFTFFIEIIPQFLEFMESKSYIDKDSSNLSAVVEMYAQKDIEKKSYLAEDDKTDAENELLKAVLVDILRDNNSPQDTEDTRGKMRKNNFRESHNSFKEQPSGYWEAQYVHQSKDMVIKKLLSFREIIRDHDKMSTNYILLFWLKEENPTSVKGNFLINDKQIVVRSHRQDFFGEACDLIEDLFSFTVMLKEKKKIIPEEEKMNSILHAGQRSDEESDLIVDMFLNTPLDREELGEVTPLELAENREGQEILRYYIEIMELRVHLISEEDVLNEEEIKKIKNKLGLDSTQTVLLKDEIERLLVNNNQPESEGEFVSSCIVLWRDFIKSADDLGGHPGSWAAALEYLTGLLGNYTFTQQEIGNKYGVTAQTISRKYRQIAAELGIPL